MPEEAEAPAPASNYFVYPTLLPWSHIQDLFAALGEGGDPPGAFSDGVLLVYANREDYDQDFPGDEPMIVADGPGPRDPIDDAAVSGKAAAAKSEGASDEGGSASGEGDASGEESNLRSRLRALCQRWTSEMHDARREHAEGDRGGIYDQVTRAAYNRASGRQEAATALRKLLDGEAPGAGTSGEIPYALLCASCARALPIDLNLWNLSPEERPAGDGHACRRCGRDGDTRPVPERDFERALSQVVVNSVSD